MRKQEVVKKISTVVDLPATEVKRVVEEFFNVIKQTLAGGEAVHFRGFGSFIKKRRASKVVQNIRKGQRMILPAREVPHFKPSKNF